jgi:hypothetical protein
MTPALGGNEGYQPNPAVTIRQDECARQRRWPRWPNDELQIDVPVDVDFFSADCKSIRTECPLEPGQRP